MEMISSKNKGSKGGIPKPGIPFFKIDRTKVSSSSPNALSIKLSIIILFTLLKHLKVHPVQRVGSFTSDNAVDL
jgi:hypothetical protein